MKRLLALFLLSCTSTAYAVDSTICPGLKSTVDEDFRVLESQLTYKAAQEALAFIEKHKGAAADGEYLLGLTNSEITLTGYALLSLAQSGKGEAKVYYTKRFCDWLSKAAWHD